MKKISIILTIFFIDRIIKIYLINLQGEGTEIDFYIFSFLNIYLVWNTGIGFGLIPLEADLFYHLLTSLIILPLSIPAFASIFILQFLWVWNDLLVGLVFLDQVPSEIIITAKLRELLGSRGENWEILTTGAFVSMTVPLLIFFLLQRYFIRGLVAGSVKG